MSKFNVHVQRAGNLWAVRLEGAARYFSTHASERAAVETGRQLAKLRGVEVLVHGLDEVGDQNLKSNRSRSQS